MGAALTANLIGFPEVEIVEASAGTFGLLLVLTEVSESATAVAFGGLNGALYGGLGGRAFGALYTVPYLARRYAERDTRVSEIALSRPPYD